MQVHKMQFAFVLNDIDDAPFHTMLKMENDAADKTTINVPIQTVHKIIGEYRMSVTYDAVIEQFTYEVDIK